MNNEMTSFNMALQKSCAVRPCSYSPLENFEPVEDEYGRRKILSLPYKLLWFHTYCAEKGLEGHVEADDFSIVSYPPTGSSMLGTAIVTAKARVYINGKLVATASAGKGFVIDNTPMMDGAIQAASGSALSRALSNAGFGCISADDSDGPAPSNPETLPFAFPDSPAPVMSAAPSLPTAVVPPIPQQPTDPLGTAKTMVWSGRGVHSGKSLGEILATSPNTIIWIAECWNGTGPVKEAALMLLEEAKRRCGK